MGGERRWRGHRGKEVQYGVIVGILRISIDLQIDVSASLG